jgi:hypothetical protein
VTFSEPVDSATAGAPGNYLVYETSYPLNAVIADAAERQGDSVTVLLVLDRGIGEGYSLAVSLVTDLSCRRNVIESMSTIAITDEYTGDDDLVRSFPGALRQNYPNPFNPSTVISFVVPGTLPGAGTGRSTAGKGAGLMSAAVEAASAGATVHVLLSVYDVSGRLVRTLVDGDLTPGVHDVPWNGVNELGAKVSSGVYFYRITSGRWSETKKMVLLK